MPEAAGSSSARQSGEYQANWFRSRWVFFTVFVVGIVAVGAAHEIHHGLVADVVAALGEALLIAGLLAISVDWFFKQQLVHDAFEASFGYLLPEGLKPEVRWLVGQQLLCVEYDQHFKLTEHGDQLRVDIDLSRRIVNAGPNTFHFEPEVWIDEWFQDVPSDIDILEVYRGNDRLSALQDRTAIVREACAVRVKLPGIDLDPTEDLREHWHGHEIKPRNGSYSQTVRFAVSNPTISVETCQGIKAEVQFGHRTPAARMTDRWLLQGMLLPNQMIMIRWWEEPPAGGTASKQAAT